MSRNLSKAITIMELTHQIEQLDEPINCADVEPGYMFPDPEDKLATELAKAVCQGCVIMEECREDGIRNHELGVWGGTSEKDRNTIVRKRTRRLRALNGFDDGK